MKDTFHTTVTAIGAGIVTTLLGGWDRALGILLIVIVLDYLTGVASAFKSKTVSSSVGFSGLLKKASIFLIVILAAQVDRITGNTANIFRTCTSFFFIANDALSVIENVGELGVKLPAFLKNALIKLRDENDLPSELGGDEEQDTDDPGDGE
jgi:toxin secretion/phage lysis holin